jgi:hypothetical protein
MDFRLIYGAGNRNRTRHRLMCEQMGVIHAQVMDLNRMAKRMEYLDQKEKVFGLVVKMQGELRKTAAALKEWRAPIRQFIVA